MTVDKSISEHVPSHDPLSVHVVRIELQPDKYNVLSPDALEVEVLSSKRAVVAIGVKEGYKESQLTGIVEFRGDGFTLTRKEGDCNVEKVGGRLALDYLIEHQRDEG